MGCSTVYMEPALSSCNDSLLHLNNYVLKRPVYANGTLDTLKIHSILRVHY